MRLSGDSWVVVAAYNEQGRIRRVLEDLAGVAAGIVVVDDGSSDATASEVLKQQVWLLRHACNLGQGAALQTGISFALQRGAGFIATFDADGQHCAADLVVMQQRMIASQADIALGSRFLGESPGIPWSRRVTLRLGVLFTLLLSGVRLTDTHNGLRLFSRRAAERLRITMNRMEHASEIIDQVASSGLKFIEVPVRISYSRDSLEKGQRTSAAAKLAVKLIVEKFCR